MKKYLKVLSCLLFISSSTFAILPATKQQILCGATYIVNGKVLNAERSPTKCSGIGVYGVPCAPGHVPGYINLSVEVDEVLGVKNVVSRFPRDVGIAKGRTIDVWVSDPKFEDASITAADISRIFEGRPSILGVTVRLGDVWKQGRVLKDYLDTPPYFAKIWPAEELDWIRTILSTSNGNTCPK